MMTPLPPPPLTDEELLAHDGRALPPEAAALVERRLMSDPAGRETLAEWRRQDAALAALVGAVEAEPVPDRLLAVVRRARAEGVAREGSPRWRLAVVAAFALAVGAAGGWAARALTAPSMPAMALAEGAMRAHETYVVEVRHPIEVPASDADHLRAWMSNRLGYAIAPPDLTADGLALLGGRIVPAAGGAAALYMYEDDQGGRVTLFVAREDAGGGAVATAFRFDRDGATGSVSWTGDELGYAVVGQRAREELRRIARTAYDQLT